VRRGGSLGSKAILLLADGSLFEGTAFGKSGTASGELCFNTGMTGYQEIYTDPSYFGQILINTHSHIGNYGIMNSDNESRRAMISGLVVRNFSSSFSRHGADGSLQDFLVQHGVPGISIPDTRKLVRHIRSKGAMNGIISSEESDPRNLEKQLRQCPDMTGLELASLVSAGQPYFAGKPDSPFKVAALDFGIKSNILRCLADAGCYVRVFPAKTSFQEMETFLPDGYFLSNGPGDPSAMDYAVGTTRQILNADKPLFGICLGHQVLCLANGISTSKMHFGHRGINHPVKNLDTGLSEITSQNHGFAASLVDAESAKDVAVTHINLNDGSLEGIRMKSRKAFSVQFHPEANPGPHDSRYLFRQFISMMEGEKAASVMVM